MKNPKWRNNNEKLLESLVKSSLLKWVRASVCAALGKFGFFSSFWPLLPFLVRQKCLSPSQSVAMRWFLNSILIFLDSAYQGVSIKWTELHQNEIIDHYKPSINFLCVFQLNSTKQDVLANHPNHLCADGWVTKNIPKNQLWVFQIRRHQEKKMCWVRTHPNKYPDVIKN